MNTGSLIGRNIFRILLSVSLFIPSLVTRADVIDFDSQGLFGPSTFVAAGPAQTLDITTSVGVVTFQGGVIITAGAGNNLDTTSVYAIASDLSGGFTNFITITFPVAVTNFSIEIGNGEPFAITYVVSDNSGHNQSFSTLFASVWQPTFAVGGPTIEVEATPTAPPHVSGAWNFWIDNITFDAVPEPSSMALLLGGLASLAFLMRGKSRT